MIFTRKACCAQHRSLRRLRDWRGTMMRELLVFHDGVEWPTYVKTPAIAPTLYRRIENTRQRSSEKDEI